MLPRQGDQPPDPSVNFETVWSPGGKIESPVDLIPDGSLVILTQHIVQTD